MAGVAIDKNLYRIERDSSRAKQMHEGDDEDVTEGVRLRAGEQAVPFRFIPFPLRITTFSILYYRREAYVMKLRLSAFILALIPDPNVLGRN